MSDEKKAAAAAVTAAERAFNSAKKKADAALEKAREAVAASNTAARALVHARSNPVLFDDDPLTLIDPELVNNGVIHNGTVTLRDGAAISHVTFSGNRFEPEPTQPVVVPPQAPPDEDEVQQPPAPPASPEAPPWPAPQAEQPAPAQAPKKRTRKIAAKAPQAEQPAAPTADVEPDEDETPPVVLDGAGNPVQYAAPSAPF